MKKDTEGYRCDCGKYNKYALYVHAHSNVNLIHKCECGRINIILNYVVEMGDLCSCKDGKVGLCHAAKA